MKRLAASLLFLLFLTLVGCSSIHPLPATDLTNENWQLSVETNSSRWLIGADSWFLAGVPNAVEIANRQAARHHIPIATSVVSVSGFNDITVNGAFQTQIFGTDHRNTVYLYGPAEALRHISVVMVHRTLYINQDAVVPGMKQVIVRIGVRNLHQLTQAGCGLIEAIQIHSNNLKIASTPTACGNVYLSGRVNLTCVEHAGSGVITILGACTPLLDVISLGSGIINIAGNVGVQSIMHHGKGNINIIGANSDSLKIDADGEGKIGIQGPVNMQEINARQFVCVFAFPIMSQHVNVIVSDKAHVGLAGSTIMLNVSTYNNSVFEGRFLCAKDAYMNASGLSHINVSANDKMFGTVTDFSSIYFFGPPNLMSNFIKDSGVVVPIWNYVGNSCLLPRPIPVMVVRNVHRPEVIITDPPRRKRIAANLTGYRVDYMR